MIRLAWSKGVSGLNLWTAVDGSLIFVLRSHRLTGAPRGPYKLEISRRDSPGVVCWSLPAGDTLAQGKKIAEESR